MSTRNGKIARLSWETREEVNNRLHDGQSAKEILGWLNEEEEVKLMVARDFEGKPVSEQNLSEWRQGGYEQWVGQRELLEDVEESWAMAFDIGQVSGDDQVSMLVKVLG